MLKAVPHRNSHVLIVASDIVDFLQDFLEVLDGRVEIDVASSKIGVLEKNGYSPIGYFVLPEHCWLDNYYRPMQDSFKAFLNRNGNSEGARAVVETENREIELYEKYKTHYSYGVYIARKLG